MAVSYSGKLSCWIDVHSIPAKLYISVLSGEQVLKGPYLTTHCEVDEPLQAISLSNL